MKEEQLQKVNALELQLEAERRKREEMERMWSETQYDEVWEDKVELSQWCGEEEVEETKGYSSKDSSYVVLSSVKNTPQYNKAEEQGQKSQKP